jgi:hypothetical protein
MPAYYPHSTFSDDTPSHPTPPRRLPTPPSTTSAPASPKAFHAAVAALVESALCGHRGSFEHAVTALANATEGPLVDQRDALVGKALAHRDRHLHRRRQRGGVEASLKLLADAGLIPAAEGHTVVDPVEALAKVKLADDMPEKLRRGEPVVIRGLMGSPVDLALRQAICSIFCEDLWGAADFAPEVAVLRHLAELVERRRNGRQDGGTIHVVDFAPTVNVVVEVATRAVAAAILKAHGIDQPARVDDLPRPKVPSVVGAPTPS